MHSSTLDHELYMQKAIEMARENPQAPFGSVLVDRRTVFKKQFVLGLESVPILRDSITV